eukprot:11173198-Lingulodinium_polyedra.AAC.1
MQLQDSRGQSPPGRRACSVQLVAVRCRAGALWHPNACAKEFGAGVACGFGADGPITRILVATAVGLDEDAF